MSSMMTQEGKALIKEFEELAELQIRHGELLQALQTYDAALSVALETGAVEKIPVLACACSRVSHFVKYYNRSVYYADVCIFHDPKYVEAYWWSYKSCVAKDDDKTLTVLVCGYNVSIETGCSIDRERDFLSECAAKIPTLPPSVENRELLKNLMSPSEDEDFLTSTLVQLSRNDKWLAISLLVTGRHFGPKTCLDNCAHNCSARTVSVGRLLKCLDSEKLKTWGLELAIALLKNKASFDTIEDCFKSPVLHVGVKLSLTTGTTSFLELILKQYAKSNQRLLEKDSEGKTVDQLLLEIKDKNAVPLCRIKTLLNERMHQKEVQKVQTCYPPQPITTETTCASVEKCQEYKSLGTDCFRNEKYSDAIANYEKALIYTLDKKTLATLHGNLAECHLRLQQFTEALKHAKVSIQHDSSVAKSHVRMGRALDGIGQYHEALSVLLAAMRISNLPNEKTKIVSYFCASAVKLNDKDFQLPEEIFLFSPPSIWMDAAYFLIVEGNWEAGRFAFEKNPFHPEEEKEYSLRPFYNLRLLTRNKWVMEIIGRLIQHGSHLSSITDGTDESFLHAYFKMALVTGCYIKETFNPFVRQAVELNEDLMFDKDKNTLFHLIAIEGNNYPESQMFLCQEMLNMGMSRYLGYKNRKGKLAIHYLHENNYNMKQLYQSNMTRKSKDFPSQMISSLAIKKGRALIKDFEELAKLQARHEDLCTALSTYEEALSVALEIGAKEEIPILACSCSRVSFLTKQYDTSLHYVDVSTFHDPTFVEAYKWAYKSWVEKEDQEVALTALICGYNISIETGCSIDRQREFLIEVAVIIPTLPPSVENRDILETLKVPSEDETFLISTLEQLSRDGQWLAVSLLVTGRHSGPRSSLDNFAFNCPARSISVGRLLKSLDTVELKAWGMDLAIALLKNKASFETIEDCCGSQVLHVGVQFALATGMTGLVEMAIKRFAKCFNKLREKDNDGKTAYQRLKESVDNQSQTFIRLETLLRENCGEEGLAKIVSQSTSITTSDSNNDEKCEENRRTASSFFKEGNYSRAIFFYRKSISQTTHKKTLGLLYGNLAECCLKLRQYSDAIEYGEKSIENDPSLTKSYVRLGRAISGKGRYDEAIDHFRVALEIEQSFVERATILTYFNSTAIKSSKEVFHMPRIQPSLWIHSAYLSIKSGNWEASRFAFTQCPSILTFQKAYSLRPFYNIPLLRENEWAMEFLGRLITIGSKLSSVAEGTEDSYLHVYFEMVIATERCLYETFTIVSQAVSENEKLMFDKDENTLFHLIVRNGSKNLRFQRYLCQELIDNGMSKYLSHRNTEGEIAISYAKGNSKLRQFLKNHTPKLSRDETKRTHPLRQRTYSSEAVGEKSVTSTAYSDQNFVMLTRKLKQNYHLTEEEEKNIIDNIAERIRKEISDDDISSLTSLPLKYFGKVLEALLLTNKTSELLNVWKRSRKKMAAIPVKFARNCSLTVCLRNSLLMTETDQIAFLEAIIGGGVREDIKTEEEQKQIMQVLLESERHNVCLFLIGKGVSPEFYTKKEMKPLFLAISLALEKGDCTVLEYLISSYQRNKKMQCLNPNQQDADGRILFHYVCLFEGPIENAVKVASVLSRFKVKEAMVDHHGKTPNDYLKSGDERKKFVGSPTDKRKQTITERIKESKKEQLEDSVKPRIQDSIPNEEEKTENSLPKTNDSVITFIANETHNTPSSKLKVNGGSIMMEAETIKESLEERESSSQESDISEKEDDDKEDIQEKFIDPDSEVKNIQDLDSLLKDVKVTINGIQLPKPQMTKTEHSHVESDVQLSQKCSRMENEISEDMVTGSIWQVELAPEVVAFLRNSFVDRAIRLITLQGILRLASGDKMQYQAEPILTKRKDLSMYQSSFNESEQIIWEKAVTYIPHQMDISGQHQRTYSQVIRVWNVINSDKKFRTFLRKIEKVTRNSRKCTQQRKLVANPTKKLISDRDIPVIYHKAEDAESETYHLKFAPPANSERGEYNLIKFQNLTPELVDIILQDPEREASFPFNVLEMEHEIIEMDFSVPIVLQGRSGTGKTTCCLYRLWKQFAFYWEDKLLNDDEEVQMKGKTEPYQGPTFEELEQQTIQAMKDENESVYSADECNQGHFSTENEGYYHVNNEQLEYDDYSESSREEEPLFRQLFITKSQFLCQQVREQLNLLMNGVDWTKEHIEMTKQPLPYRLEDLGYHHYPLVLNSHQFLLMLDASLGVPYFFDRNEDLSLEYEIPGWNYGTSEGIVADSDESDEDSDDESTARGKTKDQNTDSKKKTVPKITKRSKMREVTYEIFEKEVWSKIKHKASREIKCHPSMIWKEIVSFIRGSYECMLPQSRGCLSLEDYIKVGRKKAPDFDTEDRKIVYELFKLYEKHKRKMNYFDETDVIRFIVKRMQSITDFEHLMFDQVYVDETQDFTLAELWLLVRYSADPSQMFLAGDTAQAIMHGVSFRFSDLVSLFQLFDEKYKESLKVLHLRENYRSHNGVLDLASSIVDVIMEYFNESFDVLDRDLGMYPGPKPAIIDCHNEQDLLLLLNNKQQKIEFGAHQVILVLDEESKKYLPEEFRKAITLTVPESKGLEFDDVLIFNFFKDSKAEKQWRIVTKFLQRLAETKDDNSLKRRVAFAQETYQFPRQKDYEPKQDRILCTLLKKLYTAVSRARVNVWIYDSSEEERQHMYNYFRMRNLVETVTKDNIKDRIFTKKTSREEWIRQGEKLMKRKIYHEAVKCFVNGKDKKMTELALAFHQMITADKQRDRRIKTQMHLAAADRFIHCGNYTEAERCLRKARRKDLTAILLENTGKFERAGKLYLRLADIPSSIRCFKEARRYDLAIQIYDERQMFKEARSLCEEYNMLQKNPEVSDQMERFQPKLHYSVDFFAYKEAEIHYKDDNKEMMNEALGKMKDFKKAIDFLLQRDSVEDALTLFTKKNSLEEACKLYLKYGRIKDAIRIAGESRKWVLMAKCDLFISELDMRDSFGRYVELNRTPKVLEQKISIACQTFERGGYAYKNEAGEAYLLLGMILRDDRLIGRAFGKFSHAYPKNLAGMLECMDWMTNNARLSNWKKMTQVILGMENLADVLELLGTKESSADLRSIDKILDFYGFHEHEDDNLVEIYPAQKPIALQFLNSECKNLHKGSARPIPMDKWQARRSLAEFLLNRGKGWIKILRREMLKHRNMKARCPFRDLGEGCNPRQCEQSHNDLHYRDHRDLLVVDLWFMALDFYSNRSPGLTDEKFYQSVKWFVEDLIGNCTFLRNIKELRKLFSSTLFKRYFSQVHPFVPHIKSFIIEYIKNRKESLTPSNHYLSSEVLIEMLLLYNLFSLQPLEFNLPIETVCDFENNVKREFLANRVSKKLLLKGQFKLKKVGQAYRIHCIAREYYNAMDNLLRLNDPYAALMKYVDYVSHHEMKDLEFVKNANIAMWMEYMVTVGLVALAKIKRCLVFIPTGYLDTVEMTDILYERREHVLNSIKLSETFVSQNSISYLMDKLTDGMIKMTKSFKFTIEGSDESTMRLLRRIITIDITLLCNMNTALTSRTESGLVQHLHKLSFITSLMNESRFKEAITMLPMTKTQKGMCLLLKRLHEGQKNHLSVFHWSSDETFETLPLLPEMHMRDKDYDIEVPQNQLAITNETNTNQPNDLNIIYPENETLDDPLDNNQDDKEKGMARKFFKRWILNARVRHMKRNVSRQINVEFRQRTEALFKDAFVDESTEECGICGLAVNEMQRDQVRESSPSSELIFKMHLASKEHTLKSKHFNQFLHFYIEQFSKSILECERLIDIHDLKQEQTLTSDIENCRRDLIRLLNDHNSNIRSVLETRDWSNLNDVLATEKELSKAVKIVKNYIRDEKARKFKEQRNLDKQRGREERMKAKMLSIDSDDDDDDDDDYDDDECDNEEDESD